MTIDRRVPEFSDLHESLDGEVFLERVFHSDGNLAGFITAPLNLVRSMKGKKEEELEASGWIRYRDIIESIG